MADYSKILEFIGRCDDAGQLKALLKNAQQKGASAVTEAAFRKLIAIVPSERPGTVEHDFWQTVHAFEYSLSEERGKTTRLSRTRQKVGRAGVIQTLKDWALSNNETDGFKMLIDRGMPELTGEAIVLRHPEHFTPDELLAARKRLSDAGVDVDRLPGGTSERGNNE